MPKLRSSTNCYLLIGSFYQHTYPGGCGADHRVLHLHLPGAAPRQALRQDQEDREQRRRGAGGQILPCHWLVDDNTGL